MMGGGSTWTAAPALHFRESGMNVTASLNCFAQGSQFGLEDVEVVVATVDLDEVVTYRYWGGVQVPGGGGGGHGYWEGGGRSYG